MWWWVTVDGKQFIMYACTCIDKTILILSFYILLFHHVLGSQWFKVTAYPLLFLQSAWSIRTYIFHEVLILLVKNHMLEVKCAIVVSTVTSVKITVAGSCLDTQFFLYFFFDSTRNTLTPLTIVVGFYFHLWEKINSNECS